MLGAFSGEDSPRALAARAEELIEQVEGLQDAWESRVDLRSTMPSATCWRCWRGGRGTGGGGGADGRRGPWGVGCEGVGCHAGLRPVVMKVVAQLRNRPLRPAASRAAIHRSASSSVTTPHAFAARMVLAYPNVTAVS